MTCLVCARPAQRVTVRLTWPMEILLCEWCIARWEKNGLEIIATPPESGVNRADGAPGSEVAAGSGITARQAPAGT